LAAGLLIDQKTSAKVSGAAGPDNTGVARLKDGPAATVDCRKWIF